MHCHNGLNNKLVESLVENKVAQETGDLKYLQDSMYDFVSTLKEIILGEYSPEFFNKYVDEALKLHGSNLEEFLKIPKMGLELKQALNSIDDAIDTTNQEFKDNLVLLLDKFQTTLDNVVFEARSPYDIAVKYGFEGTEEEWLSNILNSSETAHNIFQDAKTFADFLYKPADFMVARRLAPSVRTLDFYLDSFDREAGRVVNKSNEVIATINAVVDAVNDSYNSSQVLLNNVSDKYNEAIDTVNSIKPTVISMTNDAINNTAVEGGVLADSFVTATANGVGSVARTQRDKNSDIISIKDFPDIATAQSTAEVLNSKIFIPAGEHEYDATNYNPGLFYGDGIVVDTASGKRYKPNHKWYVTPEMFGAIGDGVADDSDALIAADLYARDNELALIGTGKYLITKTWSIKTHSVDISKKGIVIAPNFEHEAAVIGNGNYRPYPSYHTITFYGNRQSQTHGVIAYLVNDQASNGLYVKLSAQECNTVLLVGSAVERSEFDVWAARCDSVVEEIPRDRPGDVTADEVKYYISGGSCGRWFYKNAAAACVVEFNVEQTEANSEHAYAVEIAHTGNKGVVLKGIIRVTEGKAILGTGTATLIFNELLVVGAKDTVLTLDSDGAVYGSLTAQYSEADVLDFKKLVRGGNLNANIDSYRTKGITLGSVGGRVTGLMLRAKVYQGSTSNGNILESRQVAESHIDINATGLKPNGVYIGAEAAVSTRYSFNSVFLTRNVPFTYNSKTIYDIEFIGSVYTSSIRNFSTPLAGMRASSRDNSGITLICKGTNWYEPTLSLIS